ncbi:MAG: autotransporter-associated beta strand repeat-containing protein [Luteolibacter sp.]
MKFKNLSVMILGAAVTAGFAQAADISWNSAASGTWQNSTLGGFSATYNNGDNVTFPTLGSSALNITLSGLLAPGDLTVTNSGPVAGSTVRYNFNSTSSTNGIYATGNLNLNSASTNFANTATTGAFNSAFTFGGALNYSGGSLVAVTQQSGTRAAVLTVGSLAAPSAAGQSLTFGVGTASSVVVSGSKPAVTNGMISPGIQTYAGGNLIGDFATFSGNNLISASANYTPYSGDWSAATSSQIVNLTAATTLTGSGALSIYSLRSNGAFNQNLGGRTINLGSGGLITGSGGTWSNGTLNFGSSAGFIGAYNTSVQTFISAVIDGTGGLTVSGVSQALNLSGANTFTGGLFVNGGVTSLANNTAANGNEVTINALGTLRLQNSNTIAGLSGNGAVVGSNNNTNPRTLTIDFASGTKTFSGTLANGAGTSSTLSITKAGNGTQVLSGTATYTGTTSVNAGTLVINGDQTSATGNVSVSGTLAGNGGKVGGATTINSGGHLALGDGTVSSIGTTEIFNSTLAFAPGSIFDWDINTGTGAYDKTALGASNLTVAVGAKFNVISSNAFSDAFWNSPHTWTDIFGTNSLDNFTIANFTYSGGGSVVGAPTSEGAFTVSGNTLTWTAVPEPTSALAGLVIIAGLFRRRRSA